MPDKCNECKGTKEYAPLGSIVKKCSVCSGAGYIIPENSKSLGEVNQESVVPESVQKKRGRPKSEA